MKKQQIYPILTWAIIILCIVVFIATPIWQSVPLWSNEVFRLSFLGNWSATMLGALVGIPIALALSKWQQTEQERSEKERQEQERIEREKFILNAIGEELLQNQSILEAVMKDHDQHVSKKATFELQDVLWKAFSDGGELKWIDEVNVIRSLARAYGHISTLIHLERQYTDISETPNIILSPREKQNANRAKDIRRLAHVFVRNALQVLNGRIDRIR